MNVDDKQISRIFSCVLAPLVVVSLLPTAVVGQSITSGDVTGTVTDPTNAVVPNASVTLTNLGANATQTTNTNSGGGYRFAFVTPGTYRIKVSASGFQSAQGNGFVVNAGQPTTANFQLKLKEAAQTVEVKEASLAPGVAGSLFGTAAAANQALLSQFESGGTLNSISQAVPGFAPPSIISFPSKFHQPTYYKWNFEIQQQVGWRMLLSLNYSGMHGSFIPVADLE